MIDTVRNQDRYPANDGRLKRMERVLITIGLLSPLRYGSDCESLRRDLNDAGYAVCERTVWRDLLMLERIGMVRKIDRKRWQWCGIGPALL